MALPSTFSRRKRTSINRNDPLQYETIPAKLRQQALQIFEDALQQRWNGSQAYEDIVMFFRRELGVSRLVRIATSFEYEFHQWFLTEEVTDYTLDAIEVMCRYVTNDVDNEGRYSDSEEIIKGLVQELNARMLEAGVGYQFENEQIIQADSRLMHAQVTVPTLSLLSEPKFEAAHKEYLEGFDAVRQRDYETSLTHCAKAFESTLKVIAAEEGWNVRPDATASQLLRAAFDNDLVPSFLQNEFSGLRAILEGGTPAVRNKSSAHGAGTTPRQVPRHMATFQLHQTGAAILFLIEGWKQH
jgi:hypothetical protein